MGEQFSPDRDAALSPESSRDLLVRARAGDQEARDRLYRRYLPLLRRWASGRLPRWARDIMDTDDLVQDAFMQSLKCIEIFEPRFEGALRAYLRQALLNEIRDRVRAARRRPATIEIESNEPDPTASPLEEAIGHEAAERYEAALSCLNPEDREAIMLRVEMECDYATMAAALGKNNADAARMAVSRALVRLAREMNRHA